MKYLSTFIMLVLTILVSCGEGKIDTSELCSNGLYYIEGQCTCLDGKNKYGGTCSNPFDVNDPFTDGDDAVVDGDDAVVDGDDAVVDGDDVDVAVDGDDESSVPTGDSWYDPTSGLTWQMETSTEPFKYYEAKAHCDSLEYDGHSDWYVPTISELRTLIRGCGPSETSGGCGVTDSCLSKNCDDGSCTSCPEGKGPANGCYWPVGFSGTCTGFWSSSLDSDDGFSGWIVVFKEGYVRVDRIFNFSRVRCVRSGDDVVDGDEDLEDEVDDESSLPTGDSWSDPISGLTWQVETSTDPFIYTEAKAHCNSLEFDGHSDWRLPTISELRTLIRGCENSQTGGGCGVTDSCLSPNCNDGSCTSCPEDKGPDNGCYWPVGFGGTCTGFWSSSITPGGDYLIWIVAFKEGRVKTEGVSSYDRVRCVRSGI